MNPEPIGKTDRKCPRCRSGELTATEITAAEMSFRISGGVLVRDAHTDNFGGILSVHMECRSCCHRWKPRRVSDVHNLLSE